MRILSDLCSQHEYGISEHGRIVFETKVFELYTYIVFNPLELPFIEGLSKLYTTCINCTFYTLYCTYVILYYSMQLLETKTRALVYSCEYIGSATTKGYGCISHESGTFTIP
jgi:hypothetical protein